MKICTRKWRYTVKGPEESSVFWLTKRIIIKIRSKVNGRNARNKSNDKIPINRRNERNIKENESKWLDRTKAQWIDEYGSKKTKIEHNLNDFFLLICDLNERPKFENRIKSHSAVIVFSPCRISIRLWMFNNGRFEAWTSIQICYAQLFFFSVMP